MPLEQPEQPDRPESPGRIERPEPADRDFTPADRADLTRLTETSERWADLDRYDGNRANLSNPDRIEAATYIRDNLDSRPWLEPVSYRAVDIQRVFASIDQGRGHPLERHEGFADDEKLQRRVTALEDPAQLDPDKRVAGIDGCKPGNKAHHCADMATAIQDPEMFATAFTRGVEHPRIRQAFDTPSTGRPPAEVRIPIEELLGPEGHQHCNGYQLAPVDGSTKAALEYRNEWASAKRGDPNTEVAPPRAEQIDSFDGGDIVFRFIATSDRDGWEIVTMYPEPAEKD